MYERITMSWWDRFWGRSRFIEDWEWRDLSENKRMKYKQVAPIPPVRPLKESWNRPTSGDSHTSPPIMPDFSSYDSGPSSSSHDSGSYSSDSGSISDFGGGDGGGGGASGDY